ncbi:CPBP family intramembrane glutamic endopeptidase [Nocardia wallacei]|uniref:CAAX prenyl protease 2/Lysostaphin resistance protein A-like domain-containing protein n=1 Tax=Nocardia wallacei TaxID=480035 RepID=A0A7G1KV26_9NOCA|nr:CPBP family intramembrane glutamic endopeptidase [Nocardia wallacei]BCK59125.1 hypothetical protein NWFMUON74_68970 [Nocardia wallacei]
MPISMQPSRTPAQYEGIPPAVPWGELAIFIGVTFTGITAAALAWTTFGDIGSESDALLFGGLGMCTPALGLLVAAAFTGDIRRPRQLLASTGISRPDSWRRLARFLAVGLLLPLAVVAATIAIAVLTGVYRLHTPFPVAALATELAISLVTFVPLLVLMFGEEWGWGYLLPRLLPLGMLRGVVLSGLIWGLFHAPLTLQGYLYPSLPGLVGMLIFTTGSLLLGCLMAWIRIASGSLWPAVVLHGSSNLLANPIPATIGAATGPVGAFQTSVPGSWPSWIAMSAIIAVLVMTGQYRRGPISQPIRC